MAGLIPSHVFLDLNLSCNLRCIQCGLHAFQNPPGRLTLHERRAVIKQVAAWDQSIRLVLTGGEQFLDPEALWDAAACCRDNGVYTTLSTNGTQVSGGDIDRLPTSGIRCVVVSLDSHRPEVHDLIRGVPGTWERAVQTVQRLVEARDRSSEDFSVLTSTILGEHNLDEIDNLISWLTSLGVDTTLYQPIQPPFPSPNENSWYLNSPLWPKKMRVVEHGIDRMVEMKLAGARMYQRVEQFEDMRSYFRRGADLPFSICRSIEQNLMVDIIGQVRFCFQMDQLGVPVAGHVRTDNLHAIWARRGDYATAMVDCRKGCGAMICHAR